MKIKKFIAESPIFALYRGHSLFVAPFQIRLAQEGVHFLQGLILTALFFEEREVRPREMAKVFQVSKSNLSHALRSLEKKGWLKRAILAEDARGYLFSLTSSGRKKALTLIKTFDEAEDKLEKVGVKATKDFVSILTQYLDNYSRL